MNIESVVQLSLAGVGLVWSAVAIDGGYTRFRMIRREFAGTMLPLFILSALSFAMLAAVALDYHMATFKAFFFVCSAAMVAWLFRDYVKSMAWILPALLIPSLLASVGLIAVALALFFCVFALLFMFSSMHITDAGSFVVLGADALLVVAFSLLLYYTVFNHPFWFFIGTVFYAVGTWLFLMPAVAVEVVRRHAPEPQ
ncbi:MAG: hypothetical protein QXT84_04150 [Candidatus Bathyarchaeia archaeon]